MREIRFRGKSIKTGKWIYGNLVINKQIQKYQIIDETLYGKEVDKETIGQYTGLHDKNGKEIYEGDILEIIVNNNIIKKCVVEFKNGIFGVMFSTQIELTAFPHFHNTTFEIIGNIYDNKNLLESEDKQW